MRIIVLAGLIASAPVIASTFDRSITTDVDRSEWHPPMKLALDLDSGRYRITPSQGSWPTLSPKPDPRSGVVPKLLRRELRRAFDDAAVALADPRCSGLDALHRGIIASNAGTPDLVLHVGGKSLPAGRSIECWTPATETLQRLLEKRFAQPR
jgi:hypothetical protein